MVDLMKIADNAAVPLEKHAGAPPLQPAAVEVCDDGDASCVPTTPLEQETQGAAADDAAMKNPVRYLRRARARAVVQTEKTCQLHRMIYQVQFGGIGAVM